MTEPVLVRWGVRYFRALSQKMGPVDVGDGVHFLNPDERAALRRIERGAIMRAAVAGAVSTIVSSTAEVIVGPDAPFLRFWGVVIGATVVASTFEILYL